MSFFSRWLLVKSSTISHFRSLGIHPVILKRGFIVFLLYLRGAYLDYLSIILKFIV